MPEALDYQGLLEALLPELRNTLTAVQATEIHMARMDERVGTLIASTMRLEKAVYGNGVPGMKSDIDDHLRRIIALEERHAEEKSARQAADQERLNEKKADKDGWRKFKWAALAAVVTTALNLILYLSKFFIK